MQPYNGEEQYNAFTSSTPSMQNHLQPTGSTFSAVQARGMPSFQQQQRPIAQPYSPAARLQQLQAPSRTSSAKSVHNLAQHVGTPCMQAVTSTPSPIPNQQRAVWPGMSPYTANLATPPSSGRSIDNSPKTANQHTVERQSVSRTRAAPAVQPPQPAQHNMTTANMQGQKRRASDIFEASLEPNKRQIVRDAQGTKFVRFIDPNTGQMSQVTLEVWQKWEQQIAQATAQREKQAEQVRKYQAKRDKQVKQQRIRALTAENEKKKAEEEARNEALKAQMEKARLETIARRKREEEKQRQEAAAKATKEKAERERQARIKQQAVLDAERERLLAAQREAWVKEQAEKHRIAQEERLDKERKEQRRNQLRSDPSALYRHYREYMQYFPLEDSATERMSRYHIFLLANRPIPSDETDELALAITYAKEHWEYYLEYPRDVKRALDYYKAEQAKLATDQQPSKR